MASGSFSFQSTGNKYVTSIVNWYETNIDIANNTSLVTVEFSLSKSGATSGSTAKPLRIGIYIGEEYFYSEISSFSIGANETKLIATASKYIAHNDDGSASVYIMAHTTTSSGNLNSEGSQTVTLDKIARVSVLNWVSVNLTTKTVSWNYTRYSDSFIERLYLYSGNNILTFYNINTSEDRTLTEEQLAILYNIVGTSTSAIATAYIDTFVGNTLIGSSNNVSVPMYLPDYTLQWETTTCVDIVDTYNTFKVNESDLIVGLSKPQLTFSAKSSTNDNYGRTIGYFLNGNNVTSPKLIEQYGGETLTLKASDGRTTKDISWTAPNQIINYKMPTLTCEIRRTSPTGSTASVKISGTYYDGTGLANLSALNLNFTYTEKGLDPITISEFEIITSEPKDNLITFNATFTLENLDYQRLLSYELSMTDLVGVAPPNVINTIPRGLPAWNAYYDSNGESNFNFYGHIWRDEECFFPIGYIYISADETNPSKYFGGTWEQLKGRFLLGVGSPSDNTDNYFGEIGNKTYSPGLGSLGGSSQNRYALDNTGYAKVSLRSTGDIDVGEKSVEAWDPDYRISGSNPTTSTTTAYYGAPLGGTTGLGYNMPPYVAVYMWKRTK